MVAYAWKASIYKGSASWFHGQIEHETRRKEEGFLLLFLSFFSGSESLRRGRGGKIKNCQEEKLLLQAQFTGWYSLTDLSK